MIPPINHCHFCSHIMLYHKSTAGYCGNTGTLSSCMSFSYRFVDEENPIEVLEFAIAAISGIYYRHFLNNRGAFLQENTGNYRHIIMPISPSIILDKEKTLKFAKDLEKLSLLLI